MKVLELLETGKRTLKEQTDPSFAAYASPTLDAEVLLAHTLGTGTSELFSRLHFDVSPEQEKVYDELLKRRIANEPVAYITGKKAFYNRTFFVNRSTLIPRPETELLVEEALRLWQAYEEAHEKLLFVDVGTGSGNIAVTLATETYARVLATDVSKNALEVAEKNAKEHRVQDQVRFFLGNALEPIIDELRELRPDHTLIAANLPYISTKQYEELQPDILQYEPKQALEAGYYGLDAYWLLFRQLQRSRKLFGQSCMVLCEMDPSQETKLPAVITEAFPHAKIHILPDLAGLPRLVRAFV